MKTKTQCYKGWNEGHFYSLLKWICTGRDSWKALDLHVTTAFSSVQSSHSVMSDTLRPPRLQHIRLPCLSPTPGDAQTLVFQVGDAIQPSVGPFSSCLQSFPASKTFLVSQFFASGGQSIGVSALASVLPMNIQDWFPLGLTAFISLQFKGLKSLLQQHSSKASILWC